MVNIKVHILGDVNNETRAAFSLKELFETSLPPDATGTIDIIPNLNIPFGNVADIDLLVIGQLNNCHIKISENENLEVNSFVTVIELKEQTETDLYVTETEICVSYPSTGATKLASQQNKEQKNSLLNYIKRRDKNCPFIISNMVWLKSISEDILLKKNWTTSIPVIFSDLSFKTFVEQIIKSRHNPINGILNAVFRNAPENSLNEWIERLTVPKPIATNHLRRKLEKLISENLKNDITKIVESKTLDCIDGKAGTGKTFLILSSALKMAEEGYSCAVLTYNRALVMDMRRLISFIPSSNEVKENLKITTLDSYMGEIARLLGSQRLAFDREKLADYISHLKKQNNDHPLIISKMANLFDDYIFIDEAQDCSPLEKTLLEDLVGSEKLIIAKSPLQKIRRKGKAAWGTPTIKLKKGLRQKNNIITFLQNVAEELGISDSCLSNESFSGLSGGKVIIRNEFSSSHYIDLLNRCRENGCSPYDILILVPPQMVKDGHFLREKEWNEASIQHIDGTNHDTLNQLSAQDLIDKCRIFQYESCRGLEGWITVCMHLDQIFELKEKEFLSLPSENIISPKERAFEEAAQWIMMPLTRPIDTLVITIKNTESNLAEILKKVAKMNPDFVDCQI